MLYEWIRFAYTCSYLNKTIIAILYTYKRLNIKNYLNLFTIFQYLSCNCNCLSNIIATIKIVFFVSHKKNQTWVLLCYVIYQNNYFSMSICSFVFFLY